MKSCFRLYTTTALLPLLFGCTSNTTTLVVKSEPDGAYISQIGTGNSLGVAPVTRAFDKAELVQKDKRDKEKRNCFRVPGFNARWISGATASSAPYIRLCDPVGKSFTVTLRRNANDPGLEKDVEFSLQDKDVQIKQQQAFAPPKQPSKTVQPAADEPAAEQP
jgi:hypothetical protein